MKSKVLIPENLNRIIDMVELGKPDLDMSASRTVIKIVSVLILAGIVWVWRPLFHWLFYSVAFMPTVTYVVGIPMLVGLVLFLLPAFETERSSSMSYKTGILTTVFGICLILGIVLGGLGGIVNDRTMAYETMDQANNVTEFPESNAENPRIITRSVSDIQTRGSTSYRQSRLGTSDIARTENGNLAWSYPIVPDQFQNQLRGNQRGILMSDMTTIEDRNMSVYDNTKFKYGENMLLHRSAEWNILKGDYWVNYYDDPTPFRYEGELYMAYPKTGHEWHLTPVPHTTPTWEGVALVHSDGNIKNLNPNQAQKSEILDGQRVYPIHNARKYAESLGYRNGIVNTLPIIGTFEGVVEPASLPDVSGNSQPFVVDLEGQDMNYVYALEPTGENSRGLDEVWFFDAGSGDAVYYETNEETLFGPERAMGVARGEDTRTDWDTKDSSGQFEVVEPIPTIVDNQLWWHAKVVPVDNTDVNRNVFVNAHTGDVVEISTTNGVEKFLSGENPSNINDITNGSVEEENAEENDNADYYVVIRDENGDVVDKIPVKEGQDFDIEVNP